MKKILSFSILAVMCLMLFVGCGKSRRDALMDKYAKIANNYSSFSADIASSGDAMQVSKFSSIGIELTDIATALAKDGESMTDEQLDEIEASLNEIEETIATITAKE